MHPVRSAARPDPGFDEAVARIGELALRLHAVLDLHRERRTLLGARVCRGCARTFPCPTVRAGGSSAPSARPGRRAVPTSVR